MVLQLILTKMAISALELYHKIENSSTQLSSSALRYQPWAELIACYSVPLRESLHAKMETTQSGVAFQPLNFFITGRHCRIRN